MMLINQAASQHLPSHNFPYLAAQHDVIRPVILQASRNIRHNGSSRSLTSDSDKTSSRTVTSPTSETSLSVSSSSIDVNNDTSTSRTASCFLHEDRFDRRASRHIQSMFDDIDLSLFDMKFGPQQLQNECNDWRNTFPHLRVVGTHVGGEVDETGVTRHEMCVVTHSADNECHNTLEHFSSSHHLHNLIVSGRQCELRTQQTFITDACAHQQQQDVAEEIIAQEGNIEEIFAVDNSSQCGDVTLRSYRPRHSRSRLTPLACIHNNIIDSVFDKLWSQVTAVIEPLIASFLPETSRYLRPHVVEPCIKPFFDIASRNLPEPSGRLVPRPLSPCRQLYSVAPRTPLPESPPGRKLSGLLTVQSKALQERLDRDKQHCTELVIYQQPPALSRTFHTIRELDNRPDSRCSHIGPLRRKESTSLHQRPGSNIVLSVTRPVSSGIHQISDSNTLRNTVPLSSVLPFRSGSSTIRSTSTFQRRESTSALGLVQGHTSFPGSTVDPYKLFERMRSRPSITLKDDWPVSPTGIADENVTQLTMIRGHKLITANDRQTPSTLPALVTESPRLPQTTTSYKIIQRRPATRALSAVNSTTDKSAQLLSPDKMLALVPSRPNTMQALYRSDGSQSIASRRSSTAANLHRIANTRPESSLRRQTFARSSYPGHTTGREDSVRPEIHGIRLQRYNTFAN